jgi:6-phosphogluconolactonase (cycloisomerase 2 family)
MHSIGSSSARSPRSPKRTLSPALVLFGVLALLASWLVPFAQAQDVAETQGRGSQTTASNVLYVTTNDPTPGRNEILAFRRNANTGLSLFGRFSMSGTGVGNPNFRLGTLDSDQSLVVSPNRRFLFAVNSGSDSIAVFSIRPDGTLVAVPGSPFPSGGHFPATVGLRGNFLYVGHKNEVPGEDPNNFPPPNYTAFRVNPNGRLIPIPNSTIVAPQGASPTQTLISNDGRFVFSSDLLVDLPPTFPLGPGAGGGGTLRSFVIQPNGRLCANETVRIPGPDSMFPDPLGLLDPNSPIFAGTTNAALGLQVHPFLPILYVGFPLRDQLGVYTWNRITGELSFVNVVGNAGDVICWIQVTKDGRYAYTSNQLDQSVSVYDLRNPFNPVETTFVDLRLPARATIGGLGSQQSLTPDGSRLYVIEQKMTDADGSQNALHILATTPNGGIEERLPPINLADLGVPLTARPQGIVAF